jgi:pyruvate/2-oxoglutarate/acetoin dehydrogenase E1 component
MAILTISEFTQMATSGGGAQAGATPPVAEQAVMIGGTTASSVPFSASTRFIRVNCDVNCCLGFAAPGGAAVAVAGLHRLGANESAYYGASPGGSVAVIVSPT